MNGKGRSSIQGGSLRASSVPALICRGLLVALLFSFIFLVLCTVALYLSPLSEAFIPYLIFGGTLLGILLGSIYVGKRTEEKGWLRGGLTGLFYVLALLVLCYLFGVGFGAGFNIVTKFFLGFFFGTLGGILGINT